MSVITIISIYRIITISINAGSPRLKEISLLISSPSSFCFFSPFYGKMPWKNYLLVFLLPRGHWWEERELQIWWMFFYHYLMLLPLCMWHSHLNLRFKPSLLLISKRNQGTAKIFPLSLCHSSQCPLPVPPPFPELGYLGVFQVQF